MLFSYDEMINALIATRDHWQTYGFVAPTAKNSKDLYRAKTVTFTVNGALCDVHHVKIGDMVIATRTTQGCLEQEYYRVDGVNTWARVKVFDPEIAKMESLMDFRCAKMIDHVWYYTPAWRLALNEIKANYVHSRKIRADYRLSVDDERRFFSILHEWKGVPY